MATIFEDEAATVVAMVAKIRGRGRKAHLYIEEHMAAKQPPLTYEVLGGRLGVARQTVYRWAKEQWRLDPIKQAALAEAMDLEPEDLWRMPSRPSLDARLRGASDEEVRRAAAILESAFPASKKATGG